LGKINPLIINSMKTKSELLSEVNDLVLLKKQLYSNMDITSPMSSHEKELTKQITDLFSEINQIVRMERMERRQRNSK
jgi:hypothetical protein